MQQKISCLHCLDLNYICLLERYLFHSVWDRRFKVKTLFVDFEALRANSKSLYHNLLHLHNINISLFKWNLLLAKPNRKSCRSKTWAELCVQYFYLRWFRLAYVEGFTLPFVCTGGVAFVFTGAEMGARTANRTWGCTGPAAPPAVGVGHRMGRFET